MKLELKLRARELRHGGHSIKSIAKQLQVSKSSASTWTTDIVLTDDQLCQMRLNQSKNGYRTGILLGERAKQIHEKWKQEGRLRVIEKDNFGLLCMLYWGEGGKIGRDFVISNSDVRLLRWVVSWLQEDKPNNLITIRIHYYRSDNEIKKWWLTQLNLGEDSWRNPTICVINRASQNKKAGTLPYGTAHIRLTKGTRYFFNVLGGIDYLAESTFK